jgi:hypothetical protein
MVRRFLDGRLDGRRTEEKDVVGVTEITKIRYPARSERCSFLQLFTTWGALSCIRYYYHYLETLWAGFFEFEGGNGNAPNLAAFVTLPDTSWHFLVSVFRGFGILTLYMMLKVVGRKYESVSLCGCTFLSMFSTQPKIVWPKQG